jgi:tRNA nucleotidyltransferase (CCA-adding enzyme)
MKEPGWEHFAHPSDVGLRGAGWTVAEAFAQVAVALTAVITDPRRVRAAEPVPVACAAADPEQLLNDWLSALLAEMSARRMLFGRYDVRIDGARLDATAWGEPVDPARHEPAAEVKAATYALLRVSRTDDGLWVAQCVVDV